MAEITVGTRTLGGLKAYLDQLVEKGRAPEGAVRPLETAVRKVMETVEGDGWQNTSLDDFDLQDTMLRFSNMSNGKYTAGSLHTYELRVGRALNWYTQFLAKPGWIPSISSPGRSAKPDVSKKATQKQAKTATSEPTPPNTDRDNSHIADSTKTDTITYPWPLVNGGFATLILPRQLSSTDAKRMSNFLETYAYDDQKAVDE